MTHNLLTDRRVTGLHFGRNSEKTYDIEVTHGGRIFKRSGFDSPGQAWRWGSEQVYTPWLLKAVEAIPASQLSAPVP